MARAQVDYFDFAVFEEWITSQRNLTLDSIGITSDIARGYRERGVTAYKADELAVRAGQHPGNIWLDWWDVPWVTDEEYAKTGQVFIKNKVCYSCKKDLPRQRFGRRSSSKDGLTGDCKTCIKEKTAKRNRKKAEISG